MKYSSLGNTDLQVSNICLGTWQFNAGAADLTWSSQEEKTSREIVEKALEQGINFFDTAEAYTNSEKVLGHILQGGRREQVVIASKFGQKHPHGHVEYTAIDIENALTQSLENLKTTYIDLYQVHWPICVADAEETVKQLKLEQARGRIRHYGYSNFGVLNMKHFHEAGGVPVTNQLPYNLLWRPIEYAILPKCRELGLSVLAYSPLQQGLLSGKFHTVEHVPEGRRRTRLFGSKSTSLATHGQAGAESETFKAINDLRRICEEAGVSMTSASLSWLAAQPMVGSIVVGCSTVQQVVENTQLVTLSEDLLIRMTAATEELKLILGPNPDLWAPESRMK